MNNFFRRLKIYLIGFGIGLVFVFFFFRNRGCTWLPENRVKNTILGRVLVVPEKDAEWLKAQGIDNKTIVSFLNDGSIAFGSSKKQGNPQVYVVTREVKGKDVTLWFTLPKDAYIAEVRRPVGNVQVCKNTQSGTGDLIHFPKVKSFVYLDEENKAFVKEQERLGLASAKQIQKYIVNNGEIDFSKSKLKIAPYPIQYLSFTTKDGLKVSARTYWLEEHIRYDQFDAIDSLR